MSTAPVKFIAELTGVREVSLLGTADLGFWTDALAAEGLRPAGRDGMAQVMVIAAAARFRGIGFREVSFSVAVEPPDDVTAREAAFLVAAFNSRRLFALSERLFFSTPYRHAEVAVSASPPVAIEIHRGGRLFFSARRAADETGSESKAMATEDGWDGPVFLPSGGRGQGRYFVARIRGSTRRHPFVESKDSFTLMSSREDAVFAALRDSHFVPREWAVRPNAAHAKSKTYARTAALQGTRV